MEAAIREEVNLFPAELIVAQAREASRSTHAVENICQGFFAALGQPLLDLNRFLFVFLLELAGALRCLEGNRWDWSGSGRS